MCMVFIKNMKRIGLIDPICNSLLTRREWSIYLMCAKVYNIIIHSCSLPNPRWPIADRKAIIPRSPLAVKSQFRECNRIDRIPHVTIHPNRISALNPIPDYP